MARPEAKLPEDMQYKIDSCKRPSYPPIIIGRMPFIYLAAVSFFDLFSPNNFNALSLYYWNIACIFGVYLIKKRV